MRPTGILGFARRTAPAARPSPPPTGPRGTVVMSCTEPPTAASPHRSGSGSGALPSLRVMAARKVASLTPGRRNQREPSARAIW